MKLYRYTISNDSRSIVIQEEEVRKETPYFYLLNFYGIPKDELDQIVNGVMYSLSPKKSNEFKEQLIGEYKKEIHLLETKIEIVKALEETSQINF